MATYSTNTTIKFLQSASLSASVSGLSGLTSTQSYTVPAGHFAIVGYERIDMSYNAGTVNASTYTQSLSNITSIATKKNDIHAPEGTVLTVSATRGSIVDGSVTATMAISIFKNTP